MSKNNNSLEEMTVEMIRFMQKWGLWEDTRIFSCGNSYNTDDDWTGAEYMGISDVQERKDVNPADYVDTPLGEDDSFVHSFDMTFEGPLYDIFCDNMLRTTYGKIESDAWDFIFEHGNFMEEFLNSGECEDGEELLSNIITESDEGSAYSMWDPLKYESFSDYMKSEEYEKFMEPIWKQEEDLIPAYTLFDTHEQYESFLNGDYSMLRSNPVLWDMTKRMVKDLFSQDLEDYEVSIKGEVVDHIRKEFDSIFEKYGLDYELIYHWMLVGFPRREPDAESKELRAAQMKEAVRRLRFLGVSEKDIQTFERDGAIPEVTQLRDGIIRRGSRKIDLRQSIMKRVFRDNMPYYVFITKGAIPMEAYLYVEANADEREMYAQEMDPDSDEQVMSAVVISTLEQDHEYGSITIKLTKDGPLRTG